MNYNEEKKKGNGLLVVVIILLVILIGVGGVIIYQNYQNNELQDVGTSDKIEDNSEDGNNESDNANDDEVNPSIVELSVNEILKRDVYSLYNSIFPMFYDHGGNNFILDEDGLGFYYHTADSRFVKEIPQRVKLALTSNYVMSNSFYDFYEIDSPYGYMMPEEEFKNAYIDLFGDDNYKFEEINDCFGVLKEYEFLEEKLTDKVFIPVGCGDEVLVEPIDRNILKVEKNLFNNELYIYEVVGFFDYVLDSNNKVVSSSLYKDSNNTVLIDDNFNGDLLSYKDKLDVYKYTFKLDEDKNNCLSYNDSHYFYRVERVK